MLTIFYMVCALSLAIPASSAAAASENQIPTNGPIATGSRIGLQAVPTRTPGFNSVLTAFTNQLLKDPRATERLTRIHAQLHHTSNTICSHQATDIPNELLIKWTDTLRRTNKIPHRVGALSLLHLIDEFNLRRVSPERQQIVKQFLLSLVDKQLRSNALGLYPTPHRQELHELLLSNLSPLPIAQPPTKRSKTPELALHETEQLWSLDQRLAQKEVIPASEVLNILTDIKLGDDLAKRKLRLMMHHFLPSQGMFMLSTQTLGDLVLEAPAGKLSLDGPQLVMIAHEEQLPTTEDRSVLIRSLLNTLIHRNLVGNPTYNLFSKDAAYKKALKELAPFAN